MSWLRDQCLHISAAIATKPVYVCISMLYACTWGTAENERPCSHTRLSPATGGSSARSSEFPDGRNGSAAESPVIVVKAAKGERAMVITSLGCLMSPLLSCLYAPFFADAYVWYCHRNTCQFADHHLL
jgi:hypothetical protein